MQVDKDNIFSTQFLVATYECDSTYHANLEFFFKVNQEIAAQHSRFRGVAIPDLARIGQTWVISRCIFEIASYPQWSEVITTRTWAMETGGFTGPRTVRGYDKDGNVVFTARSTWAVLDKITRFPQRLGQITEKLVPVNKDSEIARDAIFSRLPERVQTPSAEPEHVYMPHILVRDCDINGHVNNITYMTWALESLPIEYSSKHSACYVDISWKKEVHMSDSIVVRAYKLSEDEFFFTVCAWDDEACTIHARFKKAQSYNL